MNPRLKLLLLGQVSGGGGAAWWMAAGVAPVAAYRPIGAADLATSYINLANPGVNDAAPGVAPTFDTATGWTFNGSTQYLTTGLIPAAGWSMMVLFSDIVANGAAAAPLVGSGTTGGANSYQIVPVNQDDTNRTFTYGEGFDVSGAKVTSGNMANCAGAGYVNGVAVEVVAGTFSGSGIQLFIGAHNNAGTPGRFLNGKIQGIVIWDTTRNAAQVMAMKLAMDFLA